MFDDPKKELKRMEQALWEEEAPRKRVHIESLPDDIFTEEEEMDWLLEAKALMEDPEEQPVLMEMPKTRRSRNDAVNFRRTVYADEETGENKAVFVEKPVKKKNGILPLVILLELMGIGGIIWWWIRWLN